MLLNKRVTRAQFYPSALKGKSAGRNHRALRILLPARGEEILRLPTARNGMRTALVKAAAVVPGGQLRKLSANAPLTPPR